MNLGTGKRTVLLIASNLVRACHGQSWTVPLGGHKSLATPEETGYSHSSLFQFRNAGVANRTKCVIAQGMQHPLASTYRSHRQLVGVEARIVDIGAAAHIFNSEFLSGER